MYEVGAKQRTSTSADSLDKSSVVLFYVVRRHHQALPRCCARNDGLRKPGASFVRHPGIWCVRYLEGGDVRGALDGPSVVLPPIARWLWAGGEGSLVAMTCDSSCSCGSTSGAESS